MQHSLIRLSDYVWLWPHNPDYHAVQSSVGIIVGDNEMVLIDAGNSPYLAQQISEELKERDLPPVGRIIYTHHHWDHISSACELQVLVTSHTKFRDILSEEANKSWSSEYLRQEVERNPKLKVSYRARDRAIRDWNTFRIIIPDTVFDTSTIIVLGQVTMMLEYVGGPHAEDSIVVKVPEAGIMFLGDCYYPPPLHLRTPESTLSISMLASLESEDFILYVEGHNTPLTRAQLLRFVKRNSPKEHEGTSS